MQVPTAVEWWKINVRNGLYMFVIILWQVKATYTSNGMYKVVKIIIIIKIYCYWFSANSSANII